MASGIKISELDPVSNIDGSNYTILVQDNKTCRVNFSQISGAIANSINGNITGVDDIRRNVEKLNDKSNNLSIEIRNNAIVSNQLKSELSNVSNRLSSNYYTKQNINQISTILMNKIENAGSGGSGGSVDLGPVYDAIYLSAEYLNRKIESNALSILSNYSFISSINEDLDYLYEIAGNDITNINASIDSLRTTVNVLSKVSGSFSGNLLTAVESLDNTLKDLKELSILLSDDVESFKRNVEYRNDRFEQSMQELSTNLIEDQYDCISIEEDFSNSRENNAILFNPLMMISGNNDYRIDRYTFRNCAVQSSDDLSVGRKTFTMYGIPIRAGSFKKIEEDGATNFYLKFKLSADSDVSIYSNNRTFFTINELTSNITSCDVKVKCNIDEVNIPFALEKNETDVEDDFKLVYSKLLKAGQEIEFKILEENVHVNIEVENEQDIPYNISLSDLLDGENSLISVVEDTLIGMIVPSMLYSTRNEISNIIYNSFYAIRNGDYQIPSDNRPITANFILCSYSDLSPLAREIQFSQDSISCGIWYGNEESNEEYVVSTNVNASSDPISIGSEFSLIVPKFYDGISVSFINNISCYSTSRSDYIYRLY